jgi:hypothetical protein
MTTPIATRLERGVGSTTEWAVLMPLFMSALLLACA